MPLTMELLASEGLTLRNFLTTLPGCCPARASVLRGQYVHNHGVLRSSGPLGGFGRFAELDREASTIATWLQQAGYRTALMGKYLNEYPGVANPTHVPPGWDEWYSSVSIPGQDLGNYFGFTLNENGRLVSYGRNESDYSTDVYAVKATAFVERAAADHLPFFLYLAPLAPHTPATPARRHKKAFQDATAPRVPSFDRLGGPNRANWVQASPPLTKDDVAAIDELYGLRLRSLQAVDEAVALLLDSLSKQGLLDQTYVFLTSDNGFHLGEHRQMMEKGTPYEESIRVPLLVRGPGVAAGRVEPRLAGLADLGPTFADLAGADIPDFVDGRSLVPILFDKPGTPWRRALLVEYFLTRPAARSAELASTPRAGTGTGEAGEGDVEPIGEHGLRQPEWRVLRLQDSVYIEYDTGEREYYNLAADPYQLNNLAEDLSSAELVRLSAHTAALSACGGLTCREAEDAAFGNDQPVPPMPLIESPTLEEVFGVGDVVLLRGSALDADGRPLSSEALSWSAVIRSGDRTIQILPPTPGNDVSFVVPQSPIDSSSGPVFVEVRLTATDGEGRTRTLARGLPMKGAWNP